jgi:hypothetical protein
MTSQAQKIAILSEISKALREVRNDPYLRVTKLDWKCPGSYDTVRLTVLRDLHQGSWEEVDAVDVSGISVQPNTSCYASDVVDMVVRNVR